jgi:hypothetical protein
MNGAASKKKNPQQIVAFCTSGGPLNRGVCGGLTYVTAGGWKLREVDLLMF